MWKPHSKGFRNFEKAVPKIQYSMIIERDILVLVIPINETKTNKKNRNTNQVKNVLLEQMSVAPCIPTRSDRVSQIAA